MNARQKKRLIASLYSPWLRALHSMLIDAALVTPQNDARQGLCLCTATHENVIKSVPRGLLVIVLERSGDDSPSQVYVFARDDLGTHYPLYRRPVADLGLTDRQAIRHFTTLGWPILDPVEAAEDAAAQLLGESHA